jgi:hypothetical protein
VWERLLAFEDYPRTIPSLRLLEAETYKRTKLKLTYKKIDGEYVKKQDIYTQFRIADLEWPWWLRWFSHSADKIDDAKPTEMHVKYSYVPSHQCLTWTLDESRGQTKTGDFHLQDSVGIWYVIPHPTKEKWARVTFVAQAVFYDPHDNHNHSWAARLGHFLQRSVLSDATSWIKTVSENDYLNELALLHSSNLPSSVLESAQRHLQQKPITGSKGTSNESSSFTCMKEDSDGFSCRFLDEKSFGSLNGDGSVGFLRYFLVSLLSLLLLANSYLCLERIAS